MSDALQQRVVGIVDDALAPLGFAIGGGMALRKHQIIDRLTRDVDAYSKILDDGTHYEEAERALIAKLHQSGLSVEVTRSNTFFRALEVTDPRTGESTIVDFGYDYRSDEPVKVTTGEHVLDLRDVVNGKVRALMARDEIRDIYDVDSIIQKSGITVSDIADIIRSNQPDATPEVVAQALRKAERLTPVQLSEFGLSPAEGEALVARMVKSAVTLEELGAQRHETAAPTAPGYTPHYGAAGGLSL